MLIPSAKSKSLKHSHAHSDTHTPAVYAHYWCDRIRRRRTYAYQHPQQHARRAAAASSSPVPAKMINQCVTASRVRPSNSIRAVWETRARARANTTKLERIPEKCAPHDGMRCGAHEPGSDADKLSNQPSAI